MIMGLTQPTHTLDGPVAAIADAFFFVRLFSFESTDGTQALCVVGLTFCEIMYGKWVYLHHYA